MVITTVITNMMIAQFQGTYYLVELVLMLITGTVPEFTLESQSSYHGYDKLSAPNKCEIEIIVISILINGTRRAIDVIEVSSGILFMDSLSNLQNTELPEADF